MNEYINNVAEAMTERFTTLLSAHCVAATERNTRIVVYGSLAARNALNFLSFTNVLLLNVVRHSHICFIIWNFFRWMINAEFGLLVFVVYIGKEKGETGEYEWL